MTEETSMLRVNNLHKSYRNTAGGVVRKVIARLDLVVKAGDKIAIMGPSGSGKTTLLNLLGSLDTPDKGEIIVGGTLLSEMNSAQVLAFRNKSAGFVFQFHHLLPQCNLLENVMLPTLPLKGDNAGAGQRAEELLKFMGIWEQRFQKPGELSGGECQRAAVARALINQPKLLLADEPTGSLDIQNAGLLTDLLININKQMGVTLIIATHSHAIADKMDKVYRLEEGSLISTVMQ